MAPCDWMCLNVKAFEAVAELHPYRVTCRNIAIALATRESARHWADCRLVTLCEGAMRLRPLYLLFSPHGTGPEVILGRLPNEKWIDVEKSASHQLSRNEIGSDNPCELNRSMQHSSNLLIRLSFSKRPDPLGCTQLNLDRAVFSSHQRSRMNLAVETPADWTSGRCCVDPLRPPLFATSIRWSSGNRVYLAFSNTWIGTKPRVTVRCPIFQRMTDPTSRSDLVHRPVTFDTTVW